MWPFTLVMTVEKIRVDQVFEYKPINTVNILYDIIISEIRPISLFNVTSALNIRRPLCVA